MTEPSGRDAQTKRRQAWMRLPETERKPFEHTDDGCICMGGGRIFGTWANCTLGVTGAVREAEERLSRLKSLQGA